MEPKTSLQMKIGQSWEFLFLSQVWCLLLLRGNHVRWLTFVCVALQMGSEWTRNCQSCARVSKCTIDPCKRMTMTIPVNTHTHIWTNQVFETGVHTYTVKHRRARPSVYTVSHMHITHAYTVVTAVTAAKCASVFVMYAVSGCPMFLFCGEMCVVPGVNAVTRVTAVTPVVTTVATAALCHHCH